MPETAASLASNQGFIASRVGLARAWRAAITRYTFNAELGRLVVRRRGDPEPNMKLASVENAHAESDILRSGRLHALVHEPEPPIADQKVFEPNTGDLVARAELKQGKERVARSSGQFEIASLELKRLAAEECIESSPPALVRLEERDVRKHLGGFVVFGQNDLSVFPQPELLGGSHQVRLIAHSERRAQNTSHGSADRMIHRQRFFARHRLFLRDSDCASRSRFGRGAGISCFICFAERHRNPSIFYNPNRCTHRRRPVKHLKHETSDQTSMRRDHQA